MHTRKMTVFINSLTLTIFCTFFTACANSHKIQTSEWQVSQYVLKTAPVIGQLPTQEKLKLGGFSGLIYTGLNEKNKEQTFITVTDRGPNADLIKKAGNNDMRRPFVAPAFSPQLVFLETSSSDHTLKITKQLALTGPNGHPLTGLPPPMKDNNGHYEEPVTGLGEPLRADLMGLDTECIAVDQFGNYWIGEEYRPAILSFSTAGRLVRMYVPEGYYSEKDLREIKNKFGSSAFIRQTLPKEYRSRRVNRGFEGLAVKNNMVIASLQSALDKKNEDQNFARWIILDTKTEKIREVTYPMDNGRENRIGDISIAANGDIFVIEQTAKTGPKSMHSIYQVRLPEAEGHTVTNKTLALDMVAQGVNEFEKVEGLAVIPFNQFAVVNDNDFGLTFDGKIGVDENRAPTLTVFTSPTPIIESASDETESDSAQP